MRSSKVSENDFVNFCIPIHCSCWPNVARLYGGWPPLHCVLMLFHAVEGLCSPARRTRAILHTSCCLLPEIAVCALLYETLRIICMFLIATPGVHSSARSSLPHRVVLAIPAFALDLFNHWKLFI